MKRIIVLLAISAIANVADAATDSSGEASRKLGMHYYRGEGVHEFGMGVKEDEAHSARWYIAGAELGDPSSQFHASIAYYKGAGVPRDRAQAAKWWTLAMGHGEWFHQRYWPTIESAQAKLTPAELAEGRRLAAEWKPGLAAQPALKR
jgi:TPR repeat protein